MEAQSTQDCQNNVMKKKKKAKLENVHYLTLRLTYYNAKLTKTLWYWYKNRQ